VTTSSSPGSHTGELDRHTSEAFCTKRPSGRATIVARVGLGCSPATDSFACHAKVSARHPPQRCRALAQGRSLADLLLSAGRERRSRLTAGSGPGVAHSRCPGRAQPVRRGAHSRFRTSARCDRIGDERASAPLERRGALSAGSVGVAAGPDERVAVTALDRDQRGVDRRWEARIVEFDREVLAAAPEVFCQAAPKSTLCGAPHNVDYVELSIMWSGGV
jgi:hypothetical protein